MRLDISGLAKADIELVFREGERMFGRTEAAKYISGLLHLFDLLLANPKMAKICPEAVLETRLLRYRSHIVLYRIDGEIVRIIHVFHGKQNWLEYL